MGIILCIVQNFFCHASEIPYNYNIKNSSKGTIFYKIAKIIAQF